MRKLSAAFLLLAVASVFIIISDGLVMRYKVLFGGDEIISYLCATGNSGAYEEVLHQKPPYGKLTDATEWTKFTEISEPYCFKKIANDLCVNDLHPPLYFWLLHLFVMKLGVHIYTGILLNLILQLLTLFFIFKLASLIFEDKNKGAFAALLWAVSPASVMVSMNARQYELLALVSVIYFLNFFLWQKKPEKLNAFLLAIIGAAGLLIHYSFMYVMATSVLFVFWRSKQIGWKNISVLLVAVFVSFEMMALIHPCYADSFVLQQARRQMFTFSEIPIRIGKSILSFMDFFIPVLSFKQPSMHFPTHLIELIIVVVLGIAELIHQFFKPIKTAYQEIRQLDVRSVFVTNNLRFVWFVLIILSCAVLLPYFFFITPFHAMGGQYLVYLYPFMAILCAAFLSPLSKKIKLFFPVILFSGSVGVLALMIWWNQHWYIHLIEKVQQSKVIVINNIDRRAFPRLIPYLKPGQQILMDENVIYTDDSLRRLLFPVCKSFLLIYGEPKKKAGEKYDTLYHTLYDTNDGVKFFTAVVGKDSVPEKHY